MGAKVTHSVRSDDQLWREARILAIRRHMTIGDLIDELLRKELQKKQPKLSKLKEATKTPFLVN